MPHNHFPTAEDNIKKGLKLAYDALGVFPRVKVEELISHEISELSMATYMWQFRVRDMYLVKTLR